MVTLVVDKNIPFLEGVLEPFCEVRYLQGREISRQHLLDADGLIIRTRTRCDRKLLEGTPVRFIATATIGFDHIDTSFCDSHGICWHNAAGCNAAGVAQYVSAALLHLATKHHFSLAGKTLGVIGVGHVGSRVSRLGKILGMNVLENDPPRERQEGKGRFVDLGHVLEEADIISLHVPLTTEGLDSTYHLANENFFGSIKKGAIVINTSRGPVIKEKALLQHIKNGRVPATVLDVWEKEPVPDRELLQGVTIGTPHIAGYSTEGKANGTAFCVQQASKFFGLGLDEWYPEALPAPATPEIVLTTGQKSPETIVHEAIKASYDIMADDARLRQDPGAFERLRNEYPVRREPPAYRVTLEPGNDTVKQILEGLGFNPPSLRSGRGTVSG